MPNSAIFNLSFLMYNYFQVMNMKEKTLLSGNIQSQLVSLAVPLLLGNILQQLYNTVDSLIVGHFLGTEAFAAVGVSGTVMNLFIFVLNGFCAGLSIIFAQLYGTGNREEFRQEVFVSISIGTLITLFLSFVSMGLLAPLLRLIRTPDELTAYAKSYLLVILLGLPVTYFYNLLSGILRSIGNTKAALCFLAAAIGANVLLDWLFIAVLHTGTAGAAAATVLSQSLSALLCFLYIKRSIPDLLCRRADFGFHRELAVKTFHYGISCALQQSSLYIGKILVQGAVNTLGTAGIAAYTATMRIEGFANSFGDSGCHAMSVFISQNYGAGNRDRVKDGFQKGLALHIILGLLLSGIMYVSASAGIRLFLGGQDQQALLYGSGYLRVISAFYVLCFIGNAFVGYFQGTGWVMIPFLGTTSHITLRVILSWILVSRLGLSAIAFATGLGWVWVVVFLSGCYFLTRETISSAQDSLPNSALFKDRS